MSELKACKGGMIPFYLLCEVDAAIASAAQNISFPPVLVMTRDLEETSL
jgi:hypothetical protein